MRLILFFAVFFYAKILCAQGVRVGAADTSAYFPLIKNKKIGLVVNQTSVTDGVHLVDFLWERGFKISLIFAPEHGFRGKADAGEKVANEKDPKTGIPIVSLYGKNYKPTKEQAEACDIFLFDIQDVGARFYTYISTMHYVMQSCAENGKTFVVLDRPNPNISVIDGPVLDTVNLRSFVGMHPIPVLHGLTVGELALMIVGEKWLNTKENCRLHVVPCKNYTRTTEYILPVKPSPNLPNPRSINLYASLCLLEGTPVSMGRGTDFPFQVYGHPDFRTKNFSFTPEPNEGNKKPLFSGQICYGKDWRERDERKFFFSLFPVMNAYEELGKPNVFFTSFFDKLIGDAEIKKLIEAGKSEDEIRLRWKNDVEKFIGLRQKYLIYE
jgi:uncharacterized protein YbbC (DUF1343 family)